MKLKTILLAILLMGVCHNTEAQFLKKLKKKAEQAAERVLLKKTEKKTEEVVENAFDSITGPNNTKRDNKKSDPQIINNDNDRNRTIQAESENFTIEYGKDMKIEITGDGIDDHRVMYDKDNGVVRLENKVTDEKHFIDATGYRYVEMNNNVFRTKDENYYKNSSEVKLKKFTQYTNLPEQPLLDYYGQLPEKQSSFKIFDPINWPLIYTPEHFQTADFNETIAEDYQHGKQFNYTDSEYSGSKIRFDEYGRLALVEINYSGSQGAQQFAYNYRYGPVTIYLPNAKILENPFQGIVEDVINKTNNPTGSSPDSKSPNGDSPSSNNPNFPTQGDPTGDIPTDNPITTSPKNKKRPKKGEPDPVPIPSEYDPGEIILEKIKKETFRPLAFQITLTSGSHIQLYTFDTKKHIQEIKYGGVLSGEWYIPNFVPGASPDQQNLLPTYLSEGVLRTYDTKHGVYYCFNPQGAAFVLTQTLEFEKFFKALGSILATVSSEMPDTQENYDAMYNIYQYLLKVVEFQSGELKYKPWDIVYPIFHWPFIFTALREDFFENDMFEKKEVFDEYGFVDQTIYTGADMKITYDFLLRVKHIVNISGEVVNFYYVRQSAVNLTVPACVN